MPSKLPMTIVLVEDAPGQARLVEYEQFAEAMRQLGLFLSIVKLPLGE